MKNVYPSNIKYRLLRKNKFLDFVMKRITFFSIILIILFSCSSSPEQEGVENEWISMETFLKQGLSYLSHPGEGRFFQYINKHQADYPEIADRLILNYTKKQRWLLGQSLKKEDYSESRYFYNNLLAVGGLTTLEQDKLNNAFIDICLKHNINATAKYLKNYFGFQLNQTDFQPLKNIKDYYPMLVQIFVDRNYVAANDLIRKDHPPIFGSGILIDDKHILTAYHIIERIFHKDTQSYHMTLVIQNRTVEGVKPVAWDPLTNLAILESPVSFNIPYSFYKLLGNSDNLKQGFGVYCIGYHEENTETLTLGIISSPNIKALEAGNWIQVDASFSPSASGGILVGKDNLIYGLLVAGVKYEEINLAIPSNLILSVMENLLTGKNIKRAWMGVILEEEEDKREYVSIRYIFPSSPLLNLDIKIKDELLSINNIKIDSIKTAQSLIWPLNSGNIVKVGIKTNNSEEKEYLLQLARRPTYALYSAVKNIDSTSTLYPYFGFSVDSKKSVMKKNIKKAGTNMQIIFYKVTAVENGSYLDDMGVKVSDYVGFIKDHYENQNRVLEIFHLPKDKRLRDIKDDSEYIYNMKKSNFEDNIL